jgi:uncharacterized protein (TIGR00290 family)
MAWSGGKDSAMALDRLRAQGVPVAFLLTTVSREFDRVSIHGVRRTLLHAQARTLGLPLQEVVLPPSPSNDIYEAAMATVLSSVGGEISGVAFGDLFLEEIRSYRERQMGELGLVAHFPLWGEETPLLARDWIGRGHQATVVVVDTTQLDGSFSGRAYDRVFLEDLPEGVDPCGERGEFHTFVHAGPGFAAPIAVRAGERVLREDRFLFCDLIEEDS